MVLKVRSSPSSHPNLCLFRSKVLYLIYYNAGSGVVVKISCRDGSGSNIAVPVSSVVNDKRF